MPNRCPPKRLLAALFCALACATACNQADTTLVAAAANFAQPLEYLARDFQAASGHRLTISTGSTGQLYAQIRNGAPFHVFLAADQRRPQLLEADGAAVTGSRFTYATGRLALWSPNPMLVSVDGPTTLRDGAFRKLAIANPDLAPYGAAAQQTLAALGLLETLSPRLVIAENIGQTHALIATGNAELGFVALSQLLSPLDDSPGSRWDVPASLHEPIRQDAVLLQHGSANPTARAFLDYLRSSEARAVIERFGYAVD